MDTPSLSTLWASLLCQLRDGHRLTGQCKPSQMAAGRQRESLHPCAGYEQLEMSECICIVYERASVPSMIFRVSCLI